MKIRVASLFSGIGGFEFGLYDALGKENVEIVFSSEIDKFASKSYELVHGHTPHGDITKIHSSEIPDHDLLVGGFPCQAFSIAGKRQGFEDTRGTLFFEVARIVKEKRPKHFILENVKGLLSHDKGQTFETIKQTLTELGYTYKFQVLNSKYFNIPQNRERIFIVGSLDEKFDFEFPKQEKVTKCIADILEDEVEEKYYLKPEIQARFIPKKRDNEIKGVGYIDNKYKDKDLQAVFSPEGISPCLTVSGADERKILVEGHLGKFESTGRVYNPEGLSCTITVSSSDETKIVIKGSVSKFQDGYMMGTEGISKTLLSGNPKKYIQEDNFRIRKLTPLECMRIQGFPDSVYHTLKNNGISNTQIYKMSGNAVSPPVISAIVKELFK